MSDKPKGTGTVMIAHQVLSNAVAISAGGNSFAIRSDGVVVGWGDNSIGELLGYETPYPGRTNGVVSINGRVLSNVVSVAACRTFSLALKKDGTIVAWGKQERIEDISTSEVKKYAEENSGIISGLDPKTGLPLPPEGGETTNIICAGILPDRTVATRFEDQAPAPLSNVVAIAAASFASLAVKNDGTVVAWESEKSSPPHGRLLTALGWSNVVAVSICEVSQGTRDVALKSNGTVLNWGTESTPSLSNVVAVAAGNGYTLALTRDGTVTGWGYNKVGEATGVPTTNASCISAGSQVRIDGQTLSNIVAITAGDGFSMALKSDGTIVAWGRMANGNYPVTVPAGLSNVVSIAEGKDFCLAITTNSAVADKFRPK